MKKNWEYDQFNNHEFSMDLIFVLNIPRQGPTYPINFNNEQSNLIYNNKFFKQVNNK